MLAANLDVSNCNVSGPGLSSAVAGRPAVLRIKCKDRFSNPATPSTSLKFGLSLTQAESSADGSASKKKKVAEEDHPARARKSKKDENEEERADRKKRTTVDALTPMHFEGKWVDGEYEIRYIAEKAGSHQLFIWADPEVGRLRLRWQRTRSR